MVDENTGRSVYNPGLSSEMVIAEGTLAEFMHNAIPQAKFPIPIEKEIRRSSAASSSTEHGSRKIDFTSSTDTDSPLAVDPPGLQWKGQPNISSSQLHIQSQ
ncbi:hypothetical protein QN277_024645 [Acacia crassicarpa]|uniref:Uncharacterized protein n=1 Tax=Acacia crassicarpa TaxID=499986 RepID=A0AAE1JCH3_9FABA|nr:hypothetical protein QN277_024645 [Acacia crassicarpa]